MNPQNHSSGPVKFLFIRKWNSSQNTYKKLDQLVGKAIKNIVPPEKLNRSKICFPQFNWNKCIKCGRCYIACYDAGRQAIEMEGQNIKYNAKKCIGCHLCRLVCSVNALGTVVELIKIVS